MAEYLVGPEAAGLAWKVEPSDVRVIMEALHSFAREVIF